MVERHTTMRQLEDVFSETFNIDTPTPDTDLLDSGILDSFQFVELLMKLEQQFGFQVDIQTIDLDDLRSLERIANLVEKHAAAVVNGGLSPDAPGSTMA